MSKKSIKNINRYTVKIGTALYQNKNEINYSIKTACGVDWKLNKKIFWPSRLRA